MGNCDMDTCNHMTTDRQRLEHFGTPCVLETTECELGLDEDDWIDDDCPSFDDIDYDAAAAELDWESREGR